MPNTFRIPLLNSFRWVKKNPITDSRYNTLPFDYEVDQYNPNGCYFAKWQTNDRAQVQFLSDFTCELKFYNFYTNIFYIGIPILEVNTSIVGQTFKCYEAEIDFSDFDEGEYYAEITYNDGTTDIIWQTSPLEVRELHAETLLYEYKNSRNDKDIIFETGIKFNFRVEGSITNYLPKSNNELYVDQEYDVTQENSIPFRNFTNLIGSARGLPNWVIDKLNLVFSVDEKQIDGVYFEKADAGSSFEPTRQDVGRNKDGYWSLLVVPNESYTIDELTTGETPIDNDYKVVRKNEAYNSTGANLTISGIFKTKSVLDYIGITNKTFTAFTLNIGTTNGGSEIAIWYVPADVTSVKTIRHKFNAITDIYLTGITEQGGLDLDIDLCYDQLDATSVIPSGGGGFNLPIGFVGEYEEVNDGDFEIYWDGETGLGKVGTGYEGCAISGTNGTKNRSGKVSIGWDIENTTERDTEVGSNLITLTKAQLPNEGLLLFRDQVNPSNGDIPTDTTNVARAGTNGGGGIPYELRRGNTGAFVGLSSPLGEGAAIDITPAGLITLKFVKIA